MAARRRGPVLVVLAAAGLLAYASVGASGRVLDRLEGGLGTVLGAEGCRAAGRSLSVEQAELVTRVAAHGVRHGSPPPRVAAVLDRVLQQRAAPDVAALYASVPRDTPASDGGVRLATALTGAEPAALTCSLRRPDVAPEQMGAGGLTPRAATVRARVDAAFGRQRVGGFAPGGVSSGHVSGSAHYDGRALDVFFRPVTPDGRARGWALASWAVAHARELGIATVIYDDRIWTLRRSAEGWRAYRHPSGNTTHPVLRHLDHVHVDVLR
jgi:hypothetical protein